MYHIPMGMEFFNAADEEQWEIIKSTIDSCDYYVLVIGQRYGSVDAAGTSFTEKEWYYSVQAREQTKAEKDTSTQAKPPAYI